MDTYELNLDGLVGPTHNYAGLAHGNLASQSHGGRVSNPRAAALEGLQKMKYLSDLGLQQAVYPPHERPDIIILRRLGFHGSDKDILTRASKEAPDPLSACASASCMWMANAATISPGADTADGQTHITPANLITQFHRSIEPPTTARLLKTIFPQSAGFVHHDPLPAHARFGDEGAANHTRLCKTYGESGIEIFAYGRNQQTKTERFPARQTLEASTAIARHHTLNPERTVFVQQNSKAIDAGVFHNDVIAVGNGPVLLYHTDAFFEGPKAIDQIRRTCITCWGEPPILIEVTDITLEDAVKSYLFNSQLVTLPDNTMALITPAECRENPRVNAFLTHLPERDTPIRSVHHVHVRQSMQNGGGPACLRLRVVLTQAELDRIHPGVLFTDTLHNKLADWIKHHYRDRLAPDDLSDPNLLTESRAALDELTQILNLGSVYPFQRTA